MFDGVLRSEATGIRICGLLIRFVENTQQLNVYLHRGFSRSVTKRIAWNAVLRIDF